MLRLLDNFFQNCCQPKTKFLIRFLIVLKGGMFYMLSPEYNAPITPDKN